MNTSKHTVQKIKLYNKYRAAEAAKQPENRLNKVELAARMGCTPSYITLWFQGKRRPDQAFLEKAAAILKLDMAIIKDMEWNRRQVEAVMRTRRAKRLSATEYSREWKERKDPCRGCVNRGWK